MNTEHIIGGVRMILHEGEVYARLIDIIDSADSDRQIQTVEEEQPVAAPAVAANVPRAGRRARPEREPRKCSSCGQPGHTARTCGRPAAVVEDGPNKSMSLKQLVQEGIDAGDGFEELCMSYPSIPAAAISKVYKELTNANSEGGGD